MNFSNINMFKKNIPNRICKKIFLSNLENFKLLRYFELLIKISLLILLFYTITEFKFIKKSSSLKISVDYKFNKMLKYSVRVTDSNNNNVGIYNSEDNKLMFYPPGEFTINNLTQGRTYKFFLSTSNLEYGLEYQFSSKESEPLIATECNSPIYIKDTSVYKLSANFTNDLSKLTLNYKKPELLNGCDIYKYIIYYSEPDSEDVYANKITKEITNYLNPINLQYSHEFIFEDISLVQGKVRLNNLLYIK